MDLHKQANIVLANVRVSRAGWKHIFRRMASLGRPETVRVDWEDCSWLGGGKLLKKKKAFQTHDNKKPPNKVKIWYFHEVPRSNENITLMKQVLKRERDLAKHSGRKMGGENKAFCKKKSGKTLLTMSWGQTDLQSQNPLQIY